LPDNFDYYFASGIDSPRQIGRYKDNWMAPFAIFASHLSGEILSAPVHFALKRGETTHMNIRLEIMNLFTHVAKDQGIPLAPLTDDLALLDSGLDSLCLAIIVARLEDLLGVDPFNSSEDFHFPVTVGDFVKCYDKAATCLEVASDHA
jgi:acyl carrier protein